MIFIEKSRGAFASEEANLVRVCDCFKKVFRIAYAILNSHGIVAPPGAGRWLVGKSSAKVWLRFSCFLIEQGSIVIARKSLVGRSIFHLGFGPSI
jgi:hypothetical protein